ncbi:hypothetical protein GQ53DRAFT_822274 [Thozetella sp. PMI_491]|nr:hypothetical protein GQ53DRAFT_822274 [Thozetella sp. PMI_491]
MYAYRVTAASSSMVMHMILAISSADMSRRGLMPRPSSRGKDVGLYHYTVAIHELQDYIRDKNAWRDSIRLDAILVTIFFMINYALQPNSFFDQANTHVAGLKALITSYMQSLSRLNPERNPGRISPSQIGLSPVSSRLLLWILCVSLPPTSGTFVTSCNLTPLSDIST